jgi:Glycosyl hydrolases family 2, TIM barrel domain
MIFNPTLCSFFSLLIVVVFTLETSGESPIVKVEGTPSKWQLTRNGQPYLIRGVGGEGSWELLAKLGGNSVRTWGHDKLEEQLNKAQTLGLTVTAGIWLGQVRQGFDWADAASLIRQRELIRETVLKYKDHPALLMWSLGNEMEDPQGANGAVWSEINNLARLVKSLDSRHPTMTVVAELGGNKVKNLHALCPDIDILGINSYAGAASVGKRYAELGGTKPYILTEFGPPGIWEIQKDDLQIYRELSSTAKVAAYRQAYMNNVLEQSGVCLGSYAFLWGQKQEVTATWFSLLLHDNSRLATVDTLSELWTGKPLANRCPQIDSLLVENRESVLVKAGEKVRVALKTSDPENDKLQVTWQLFADEEQYGTGGDAEATANLLSQAIVQSDATSAEIELPTDGGLYRIFATVRDSHGGAAIANVPVRVNAPIRVALGKTTQLPYVVYDEATNNAAYIPAGWMGDTKSIKVDPEHKTLPQAGATCMRCEFTAKTGWGAVAWQHPAQDWGDQRGGFNMTGAKCLVFYARGENGGEEVSFGFGIIGSEKRYYDTAKRSLEKVKLTRDWQRYEIKLDDLKESENLTRIKTGFVWNLASPGTPVVFYLDNIIWE